jgi:hypothetical protein
MADGRHSGSSLMKPIQMDRRLDPWAAKSAKWTGRSR